MIVAGIILLVIGVLAKIGIVWTAGFVVLIPGLIASLLRMTGDDIGGRRVRRRGFPAGRPWRPSSPRRQSGRHRSGTR